MIESASGGYNFFIDFYGCKERKSCETVVFYAGFTNTERPVTLTEINAWNLYKRFSRAYLDTKNDPVVEMDLNLSQKGISTALFNDNMENWNITIDAFSDFVFDEGDRVKNLPK